MKANFVYIAIGAAVLVAILASYSLVGAQVAPVVSTQTDSAQAMQKNSD